MITVIKMRDGASKVGTKASCYIILPIFSVGLSAQKEKMCLLCRRKYVFAYVKEKMKFKYMPQHWHWNRGYFIITIIPIELNVLVKIGDQLHKMSDKKWN